MVLCPIVVVVVVVGGGGGGSGGGGGGGSGGGGGGGSGGGGGGGGVSWVAYAFGGNVIEVLVFRNHTWCTYGVLHVGFSTVSRLTNHLETPLIVRSLNM